MTLSLTYNGIQGFNDRVERNNFSAKVQAFFSFGWLREWIVRQALDNTKKIYEVLREAYQLVLNGEDKLSNVTPKEFREFQGLVSALTRLKLIYQRADYFESSELEVLLNGTLEISYALEAELRSVAFKQKSRVATDSELKIALSESTLSSISTSFNTD